MNEDDDKVKRLPIAFKEPAAPERVLQVQHSRKCFHFATFIVDETLATVECSACHERLDPMFALVRIANEERRIHDAMARYQDEMKRLNERSRTKCEHCQKMTRISHR